MKKLLLVIISLITVLSLGACDNAPQDTELEEQVLLLEERVDAIELVLDNMVISVGLNGQTDVYINDKVNEPDYQLSTMGFMELAVDKEKDYLDTTKFPEYIWDLDEDYISVSELDSLLINKYLGAVSNTTYITGFQYKIGFTLNTEMSNEEIIARLTLLIMELSAYDFYTLDTSELSIQMQLNNQYVHYKVRMSLLVSDKYDLSPAIFYNKMMDIVIDGITFDKELVEGYITQFETEETFIGYVLPNYK